MKKLSLVVAFAAAAFLALSGAATGTHSDGTGPKKDLVAGTGTLVCCGAPQVHVNATRNTSTGEVQGHWYIRYPATALMAGFDMRGEVVCVDAEATFATVIGKIERTKGPSRAPGIFEVNRYIPIDILDMGEPGTADMLNFHPATADEPEACSARPGDLLLSQGNFIVHAGASLEFLSALDLLIAEIEAEAH